MTYVDGFVIPIKKRNLKAYRKLAILGSKLWKEHGCLDYRECVADDLTPSMPGQTAGSSFRRMCGLKNDETVVFSYIVFRNRKHRDQVNAKVMKDPRMADMPEQKMPFDMKRFAYAGFKVFVEGRSKKS